MGLIGLGLARFWLDVVGSESDPALKEEFIEKIRLIPNVIGIVNHFGSSVIVMLYYESEAQAVEFGQLLSRMPRLANIMRNDSEYPECNLSMTPTDWKIIRTIVRDPKLSYNMIARELGLTAKVVKRSLVRLTEGGRCLRYRS